MTKAVLLVSAAVLALPVASAVAQETAPPPLPAEGPVQPQSPEAPPRDAPGDEAENTTGQPTEAGEIIITATRRAEALSDVPIAVSAVSSELLENTGATDIRQLNQLSPSLLVSSTSSEAGAGVARIRGIGTVGDNPGLESSVGVFIDGVYRNRSGVALTELGAVERIEVLRGPQGTLFGRNTSAGLINIITARPSFDSEGTAQFTYGNYDYVRAEVGITGPILTGVTDALALRLDGVYVERDGFLEDVISGRSINGRDRYLIRGQLLFVPTDTIDVRFIADYANRDEECCGAIYVDLEDRVRTPEGAVTAPSIFAPVLRGLTDPAGNPAFINDDIGSRETAITPGRDFDSDVEEWGVSAEVNWDLGFANLTSITAYRDYTFDRGQDADFNNLDLFYREGFQQVFETFSQELRLQGELFNGVLDWLVGGYYANEDLFLRDRLRFGEQFGDYVATNLAFLNPALAAFPALGGFANLPGFINASLSARGVPAAARAPIVGLVPSLDLSEVGEVEDTYDQNSRNFAFFTHNVINITDALSVTLGLRYTNEEKTLDARFLSDNTSCAQIRQSIGNLNALAAANPALAPVASQVAGTLTALSPFPCLINLNTTVDGVYEGTKEEDEFTGTAVVAYKFTPDILGYASYSRGYKAGGFNLDRSALNPFAPNVNDLLFEPETVDAYEVGFKYDGRAVDVNIALFRQEFEQFQLNTFNGLFFLVENIQSCSGDLSAPAPGALFGSCDPDELRAGVTSTGIEIESYIYPADYLTVSAGVTYAETEYRERLVGAEGRPIPTDLFRLPGENLSNAPEYILTSSITYTPPIPGTALSALFYIDARAQSDYNTGSDLDIEKEQDGFVLVNGRIGLRGPEERWGIELWAQNLLDEDYTQVAFDAPLQPIGGIPGARVTDLPAGSPLAANRSNALFGRFLGEPRTYGVTVRTRF